MTNEYNTTTYIGVTSDIIARVYQHKNGLIEGFTKQDNLKKLVYYEVFEDITVAFDREKQLKGWVKSKKQKLVNSMNPEWNDLYETFTL